MSFCDKCCLILALIACTVAGYICFSELSFSNETNNAMKEYQENKRKEKEEKYKEQLEKEQLENELNKQRFDEVHRKLNARHKQLKDIWSKENPVGKYISKAVNKIENDKKLQQELLDEIKLKGNNEIYFYGLNWPVGHFNKFIDIEFYENKDTNLYELLDNQIIYDDSLIRKIPIKSGPFIGWTFETYKGIFYPGFCLVKYSGPMGFITNFLNIIGKILTN